MDVLVTGKRAELLDARLYVMARHLLAFAYRIQIDLVNHSPVGVDHTIWDVDPQFSLGLQQGDPEMPLHDHPALGGPEVDHRLAGVAGGEDVLHGEAVVATGAGYRGVISWRCASRAATRSGLSTAKI